MNIPNMAQNGSIKAHPSGIQIKDERKILDIPEANSKLCTKIRELQVNGSFNSKTNTEH